MGTKGGQGPKGKDHKGGSSKTGGEKKEYNSSDKGGNKGNYSRAKFDEKKKGNFEPKGGCLVCKGLHPMRECPKFGSLNAILEEQESAPKETEEMGSLQLLIALAAVNAKAEPSTRSEELIYVETNINRCPAKVMVDTGATHNFITEAEAKKLELPIVRHTGVSRR